MGQSQPLSPGEILFNINKISMYRICGSINLKKIFMAEAGKKPHGNKKYYHVLIDINRGELFDEYIRTKLKIKPTSWIREIVYKFLQDKIDKEVYDEALKKDQENWNRAIQNRLQGRALAKILNSIRKK